MTTYQKLVDSEYELDWTTTQRHKLYNLFKSSESASYRMHLLPIDREAFTNTAITLLLDKAYDNDKLQCDFATHTHITLNNYRRIMENTGLSATYELWQCIDTRMVCVARFEGFDSGPIISGEYINGCIRDFVPPNSPSKLDEYDHLLKNE